MKNALLVLIVVGVFLAPAFALEAMEATGTVDSINPIDPETGDYDGDIILKDTASGVKTFDVNTATVISDQATGKINSADINDGDKVKIVYSVTDQGPTAITILRLPAVAVDGSSKKN